MIAWVKTFAYDESDGAVREVYDEIMGGRGEAHNLYRAHSLRPHTMLASDYLYKTVLHWPDNTLAKWLAELISTYAAFLCGCDYAVKNHGANFRLFLEDETRADEIWQALEAGRLEEVLPARELAMMRYTHKLTLTPAEVREQDVLTMREAGASDGEIVEVNQLCASFNYYARVLNGLGVVLDDGPVGIQPEDGLPWQDKSE